MARTGPWLFAAAQALLIWVWYVLHAKRLRDAGRSVGLADRREPPLRAVDHPAVDFGCFVLLSAGRPGVRMQTPQVRLV